MANVYHSTFMVSGFKRLRRDIPCTSSRYIHYNRHKCHPYCQLLSIPSRPVLLYPYRQCRIRTDLPTRQPKLQLFISNAINPHCREMIDISLAWRCFLSLYSIKTPVFKRNESMTFMIHSTQKIQQRKY